ncbi:MAG: DegT/DnrJ/EryC1/StrS family aminotransferase [Acidobacteriota bacterium]|nr:DegT/DnrJ/EryC1/StrS family aminotransferase [Acidobacteriota bacterium]MDH3786145.1 DegT/DnrJ/EryC1/StrS family aminotransferase [Acidobacteriota bacterium]
MTVPFWSSGETIVAERAAILDAIARVLDSGRLILDREVREFESEFAARCGVQHGIGVNSGTDAIQLALRALDIGPGKRVATVANGAIATAAAIVSVGAVPCFVDVDRSTGLMDLDQLQAMCRAGIDCVVPVHLYGQCVDLDRLEHVANESGVPIVEDCAQAHEASHRGRVAGSVGAMAAYSFYPTKTLGAVGDGGMVLCNDDSLATRCRRLRFYGLDETYNASESGVNSRLDELQAAVLRTRLGFLDSYVERRRALAARYDEGLERSGVELPGRLPGSDPSWHLYVIRHRQRDVLREGLTARGIGTAVHYRRPIHQVDAYRDMSPTKVALPETEARADEILSIPLYPGLSDEDQQRVIDGIADTLSTVGGA